MFTLFKDSVSHDDLCHLLDLSGGPRDSLKCSPALYDPGGNNKFLAYTAIFCADVFNYYEVVHMVLMDSKLDVTDSDHSLSSVTTVVFDPGGSDVKDLKTDFFTYTTDVTSTTPNFERLANYLSYLENC